MRIYEAARPLLQTRLNDFHTRVATQIVVELLRLDGGDPRVAIPAIILHDVGWSAIPEELQRTAFGPGSTNAELNREHEVAGVRLAPGILESVGYPRDLTREILRIIDRHDSQPCRRRWRKPSSKMPTRCIGSRRWGSSARWSSS